MLIGFYRFLVILACAIVGYLFGSIPFGVIIGKYIYHKDPRTYGSYNTGATNVGRANGLKAAIITIILDALKIIIPFILVFLLFTKCEAIISFMNDTQDAMNEIHWYGRGNSLCELAYYIVPLGGFIGHSYSIFLKFNGGKIVSAYFGSMLSCTYLAAPVFGLIYFLILRWKKYISLSSILTSIIYCLFTWVIYLIFVFRQSNDISKYFLYFGYGPQESIYMVLLSTLGSLFLIFRHKENIKRLINHEENKTHIFDKK